MAETMTNQQIMSDDSVPTDTWGTRLAIVRQKMGWNITEAGRETGITATSWQNWENGKGCRQVHKMAAKIARSTGISFTWLVAGGPLAAADPDVRSRCTSVIDLRVIPGGRTSPARTGEMIPMALPLFTWSADN